MTAKRTAFRCPRRPEWDDEGTIDQYRKSHGLVTQTRGCSYCGSMPPDDFMAAVRSRHLIEPTDKSYKFYVHHPRPETEYVASMRTFLAKLPVDMPQNQRHQLTEEQKLIAASGGMEGKFYTQHLSEDQGWEFDALWKARKIRWGYPGKPYVPLYIPGPSTRKATT